MKGGDLAGAGQARGADRPGQVQGDQAGDQQQHPGVVAGKAQRLGWPGAAAGAGWMVAVRAAALAGGPGGQPLVALVAEQLPHPGAVQGGGRVGQGLLDLGDRVAGRAQPQHLVVGGLLGRGGGGSGAAAGEEGPVASAEVAHHRLDAGLGVAEPSRRLGRSRALQEVRSQRLVAALGGVGGVGEELRLGSVRSFR